ncbi:MAG: Flagellar P-ring protein [Firmicutes bacterium]|nr:Flagellar P-ring protein [Bacillota bacterium]
MRKVIAIGLLVLVTAWSFGSTLAAAQAFTRIKDIAKVQGVRSNQLVGYGLVVGLAGTGDSSKSAFTVQSIASMLKNFGVTVSTSQLQGKNVAAVMVTAELPPFVKSGDTIDITVSSLGDAKSLQGGMLLQTPLKAATGLVYAVGQGPLSLGGNQKGFSTVAKIPGGAIVERDVPTRIENNGNIALALSDPDFTTANRIAAAINREFGEAATATDAGTVQIKVPNQYAGNLVGFIAAVEDIDVRPDNAAKIVINERTGTVVMGGNVTIDTVAVAQGGLAVRVGGKQSPAGANETQANLVMLPGTANVGDVVKALNAVGAKPQDLIAILQAMKAAGALHAELQLI